MLWEFQVQYVIFKRGNHKEISPKVHVWIGQLLNCLGSTISRSISISPTNPKKVYFFVCYFNCFVAQWLIIDGSWNAEIYNHIKIKSHSINWLSLFFFWFRSQTIDFRINNSIIIIWIINIWGCYSSPYGIINDLRRNFVYSLFRKSLFR
jgi:hypothetical protein